MRNKLAILLAIVMLFALTAPVMANSFSDVPVNHWAYDAIKEVTDTGIITGYEDGTFKGDEKLTRYQMAVVTARMMSKLEDQEALKDLTEQQKQEVEEKVKALKEEFKGEIASLDERVSALEDKGLNLRVDGEATTTFTRTDIEGDPSARGWDQYWEDWDDTLDDDAPDQKEFKQEFDFNIQTIVDEDTTINLALDTIANDFAEVVTWDGQSSTNEKNISLDESLLTVDNPNYGVRVGNLDDYHVTNYFYDDEDVEGVEATVNYLGTDFLVFRGKEDVDNGQEIKGIRLGKDIAGIDLAGQYYKAGNDGIYGVNAQADLAPNMSSKVEYVAEDNSQDNNYLVDGEVATNLGAVNATVGYKEVGTNFDIVNTFKADDDIYGANEDYETGIKGLRVMGDMDLTPEFNVFASVEDEENEVNSDEILTTKVGAKYALAADSQVFASYEMADSDLGEDVDTINAGLEGKYLDSKLATVVDYELEEEDAGEETNTLDIRNEYAVSDTVTLMADAQYETKEEAATTDTERTYYAVGADHKLTENTSLGINYRALDFNDNLDAANDYKSESVNGEFKVSF